jgi:transcriptional regulator with XRE-family HTH domain
MSNTSEEFEHEVGAQVRVLRIARRLTQVELAELANVSLGALKSLEQGRGSTMSTFVRVLHALGRDEWLRSLQSSAPSSADFNPLDLLTPRRATSRRTIQRVRHTRSS